MPEPLPSPPRVFLSYSWDDELYKKRVGMLASRLRADGIDARIDVWHRELGTTFGEFMSREIRRAQRVLILGTPLYLQKVEAMEDGVGVSGAGWEAMLVTTAALEGERHKVVPVLMRGERSEALPAAFRNLEVHDLREGGAPERWETSYSALLRTLFGVAPPVPPLGARPPGLELKPFPPLRGQTEAPDAGAPTSPAPAAAPVAGPAGSAVPTLPSTLSAPGLSDQAALAALFEYAFSAEELRIFLHDEGVASALPGASVSQSTLAFDAVLVLERRGLIRASLFSRLHAVRPQLRPAIDVVAERWL